MQSKYESALGQAVDLLTNGFRLPYALKRSLIDDQGMTVEEVMSLEARYYKQSI